MKATIENLQSRLKVNPSSGCWEWQHGPKGSGYGKFPLSDGNIHAHRLSWILNFGEIPEGMFVCHHCDNPPCCNHEHLFLGTPLDNMADKVAKGRLVAPVGERNGNARLTIGDINEIRRLAAEGESTSALARRFGVNPRHARRIVTGDRWNSSELRPA